MIEAVFVFAVVTALFEYVVLMKMSVRRRIKTISYPNTITAVVCALNLVIHWGTITGSMTAVTAGLVSMAVTGTMRHRWGYLETVADGTYYIKGTQYVDPSILG